MTNFRWSGRARLRFPLVAATQQDLTTAPTPVVNGEVRRRHGWPLEFYRSARRQEVDHGDHGRDAHGLRRVPPLRQPQELSRRAGGLRLRRGASRRARTDLPPHVRAVVGAAPARRPRVRPAHARGLRAHQDEPPVAEREVRLQARLRGRQLRQPHDAMDGHHRHPLRALAPRRSHVGCRCVHQPLRARRPVQQHGGQLPALASDDPLHRRQPRALGVHLFHGAWSLFQSIGANSPRFNSWRRRSPRASPASSCSATSASRSWCRRACSTSTRRCTTRPARPAPTSTAPPARETSHERLLDGKVPNWPIEQRWDQHNST